MGARQNENVDLLVFCFCYFCVICDAAVARPVPFTGLGSVQLLESRNVLHCSVGIVEAVLDTPTHTRGRGCTDAASPGSPFCSLGVGCRWQTESWWGLRGSCCQELGKWERGSPVTKKDTKSCCQGRIQPFHRKEVSFLFLEARNAISSGTDNFLDPPVPVLE